MASDLRSIAKEARRDVEHKTKWARGGMSAPGKQCPHANEEICNCSDRPLKKLSRPVREKRMNFRKDQSRGTLNTEDLFAAPSDSSAEEEVNDASSAPEPVPDAEIMYSYDAPKGPAQGSQILSLAISKAVERYENKETEKLAKEYEFVDGKDNDTDGYFADEDDFEIINAANV